MTLDELERLEKAATPKWEVVRGDSDGLFDVSTWETDDGNHHLVVDGAEEHDAALIAAARNALPELIAEVRKLRAAAVALREELLDWHAAKGGNYKPNRCDDQVSYYQLRDERDALREQLLRSTTVCPKEGCMLWKGYEEHHATAEQVSEALAANSHGKRR